MKTPSFVLTLALGVVLTAPAARQVQAAYTKVQRCEAPDGSVIYTDLPCRQVDARPAPMSADLDRRIAAEQARMQAAASEREFASIALAPSAASAPVGRRSLAAGCARTPTQLAMDIQGAVALHDVNRLAESYHWTGMSHEASLPIMQRLDRIARQQVTAARFHDAGMGLGLHFADADGGSPTTGGTLLLSLHGEDGPRSLELNVRQQAGCYFVQF